MSKNNQYDLTDVANALSIIMTSENTPQTIHDSIVDVLCFMDDKWREKNVNEYNPQHLEEILGVGLEMERGSEATGNATEGAGDEPEQEETTESITGEELDVFARVLSKMLKGDYVSEEVQTHLGDAVTQIDNDWRNASNDYDSEDYIRKVMRGYFGTDE